MGLLSALEAAITTKAKYSDTELKRILKKSSKERTPEQKTVIKYFCGDGNGCVCGGCLSKDLKDEEYEGMVMASAKSIDFKQKAFDKIGLDESQVNEVPPIHFEDYSFEGNTLSRLGKDGVWRSSAYQITWLFFSSSQVYVYQYTFNMDEDGKQERMEEYFYKDITNFTTSSDTVEKLARGKTSFTGETTFSRSNVKTNYFMLSAMGDKFYCAMKQNDYTEKVIQGMKAKLREKKGN